MERFSVLNGYCSSSASEELLKILVIGDPAVGKTSFVKRYVINTYNRAYKGTIGVDFALKVVKLSDAQTIKLQLWDIAGQERFTWMTRVYYQHAHGCIIMFDLTNKKSFQNCLRWKKDFDTKCVLQNGQSIPCLLLANKCDLSQRQVDLDEVNHFYKSNNFIGWTEVSAKDDVMVADSMSFMIDTILTPGSESLLRSNNRGIRLSATTEIHRLCAC